MKLVFRISEDGSEIEVKLFMNYGVAVIGETCGDLPGAILAESH